jgi:hypothetical protein
MSTESKTEPVNWSAAGWAVLGLLSLFAWLATFIGQFFGVAWYFPWIFAGLFIFLVVKTSKTRKVKEVPAALNEVASPNEIRSMAGYKHPHLTSIPNQYTRKPCTNPEWITIPLYRDYAINCATLEVRHIITQETVEYGYDPNGKDHGFYVQLRDDRNDGQYVRVDWIVGTVLGKGHS